MKTRFSILLLATLLSLTAMADWRPIVHNFTPQEYNAAPQNWRLMQADCGWLYAGNGHGLLVFDGSSWRIHGVWNSTPIYSMALGHDDALYVGCSNDFGVFEGNAEGYMAYRSLADSVPASYRNFGEVWQVAFDRDADSGEELLYVQTRNYIFICSANGHIEVVDPAGIVYMSLLQDHCLYVSTDNGIYLYSGHRLHTLQGSELVRGAIVSAMAPLDERHILIATDFSGVFVYDGESVRPFVTEVDDFLRRNQLYSMAVGSDNIAFGTVLRGVVVTDLDGHDPRYCNRNHGLQNNTVLSLLFDSDDNLWCGLDKGIDLVLISSPLRELRDPHVEYGTGYAYAEASGWRYYGTNQGVYCQEPGSDAMSLVEGSLGQVWQFARINGRLFCCHNRGLFLLQGRSFTRLNIPEGVWNVLPIDDSRALACTYSGLFLINMRGGGCTVAHHLRGYDETVLFAQMDAGHHLWSITSRGVECISFDDAYTSVSRQVVIADPTSGRYALSKIGDRVVVSAEGYLATVDPSTATLCDDDSLARCLSGKHLYQLLRQDAAGNLIFMYDGRLSLRAFDAATGSYSAVLHELLNKKTFFVGGFANMAFCSNGDVVVGGVDGFYRITWQRVTESLAPSRIFVRRVQTDDLGILYGEYGIVNERETLRLPFGHYFLRVDYCGNNVARQGQMFQTRLLPVEEEFSEWSAQSYRNLSLPSYGSYTLEIRMHTTDAEDAYTSLHIVMASPWYVRWWAWLIYALLFAAFCLGLVNYIRYRIRQTQRRIAAEKEEEIRRQEMRILQLEKEQSQFDLKSKSRELNSVLLNQVNRNEMSASIQQAVQRISQMLADSDIDSARRALRQLEARLGAGMHQDKDWKRFEENFDFVNDRFIRRLTGRFPWMSKQEKKLCVYIYMGLQTKEIAPLLNLSTRGVEMMRYRVRKKMGLDAQANMKHYFEEMLAAEE